MFFSEDRKSGVCLNLVRYEMIWNETKECMSLDEKMTLQSARLVKQVDRVYHNVEYYRKKMQQAGYIDKKRSV